MSKIFKAIGIMSGTSLDGLDIAYCEFYYDSAWRYSIQYAETIEYSRDFKRTLEEIYSATGVGLIETDREYGRYIGRQVNDFIGKYNVSPDLISSHGHTIYHRPDKGYTLQIGSGADIYAQTGITVVADFRSVDVAYGGQGAPLVPAGDKLLFSEYTACLNLGGIANISFDTQYKRIAYDICPVNFVLNHLANRIGLPYDAGGEIAARGKINDSLLKELDELPYYTKLYPKSLGREWIEGEVWPVLNKYHQPLEDLLATFSLHIAHRITQDINLHIVNLPERNSKINVLVTGGGAFNVHLINLFKKHSKENIEFIVPDEKIVSFKEALIFAFLGVLRVENINNSLAAVTGASQDNLGGALYGPVRKEQ